MAARGEIVYWDSKKLNALKKLAEKGDRGGATIDWASAASKLPKERNILKDKTDMQLSKAYSRYKHVMEGKCYRCGKKRDDPEVLTCKKCRKESAQYHKRSKRYLVSKEVCDKNIRKIKEHISKKSKTELVNFMTKYINSFTVEQKLELFGELIDQNKIKQ